MPYGGAFFAAGPYDVVIGSVAVGLMRGGEAAPTIELKRIGEPIEDTHRYGKTRLGRLTMGAEATVAFTLMEWNTPAMLGVFNLAGNVSNLGDIPMPGFDEYDYSYPILLTAQPANTLAHAVGPVTALCKKCVLSDDSAMRLAMGPSLRVTPLKFNMFPNLSSLYHFFSLG